MSHFSKIKTNINNLDILTKTIDQLGFRHQLISENNDIVVYNFDSNGNQNHILTFKWNKVSYSIVVDMQLWNLEVDFGYFTDTLFQKYAYNIVVNTSVTNGFQKIEESFNNDGSINIKLKRWYCS
uniref:Uncharacterized protein ycf35 n=1 Tax=Polysiphonia sp. TaxID=1967842 RepID=A0A1Z1MT43_9FLOR|nr:hypothetical protein [Polysiphonia sp.]